ncbi:MarR family winged helix-turn-helix transcriptional regulator [Paraburkholderia caribensis]|uniref:MarR family winged helix-turn-helix transcriptional regulator n=1 Tax=Paraburkholderia caribensis TaxID=75105 RepID=UPI001D068F49|nr:MarR family transcriptional regulator [Paraburkholderia caribensis]
MKKPNPPLIEHDLERAIPYLVARAGSRMGSSFSKVLRDYGLSLSEWRVCASLGHRPHQRLSELVERACVDMSALSRIVDRLIAQGVVLREKSSADGRAVQLSLTAEGARLTRKIVPLAKHFEVTALNCFSQVEIDFLRDLLERLYANAESLEHFTGLPVETSADSNQQPVRSRVRR